MAILDRIKRQDAGEVEPPAIALSGRMGANPASEDFLEQSARASRQNAASAADAAAEGDAEEAVLEDFGEVCSPCLDCTPCALLPRELVAGSMCSMRWGIALVKLPH